jgi:Leucine-rich repeat (LRR) protein
MHANNSPQVFSKLHSLRELHAGGNGLTSLPPGFATAMRSLEELHLPNNLLTSVRAWQWCGAVL